MLSTTQKGAESIRTMSATGHDQDRRALCSLAEGLFNALSSPRASKDVSQLLCMAAAFLFKSVCSTCEDFQKFRTSILALYGLGPAPCEPLPVAVADLLASSSMLQIKNDHVRISALRAMLSTFPDICFAVESQPTIAEEVILSGLTINPVVASL